MRHPTLPLLLAGLLWTAAAESAPRIPAVAAPALTRVGERYLTAIPELPAGVDECELFLLPDDGSGRMIQLTPERELEDGPLRWTMPPVRASRARLVLRAGGRLHESESAPSAYFPVEPAGAPERAEVLRGEGELAWHFGRDEAPGPAAFLPPGAAALGIARVTALAAIAQDGPTAELPARPRRDAAVPAASTDADPSAPHRSRRPAFVPLRN